MLASSSFSALFNFSNDFSLEYIITAPQNFSFSRYSQIQAELLFPYSGYGGALLALEGCTGRFSFCGPTWHLTPLPRAREGGKPACEVRGAPTSRRPRSPPGTGGSALRCSRLPRQGMPTAEERMEQGTAEQRQRGSAFPSPPHLPQHLLGGREPANSPLASPATGRFLSQPSRSCHDPCGLAAARGSSLRDASGQRRARGWWPRCQPAPGCRGARGTPVPARGVRPTPAGKTCWGGSAESTVLCVAMGTECRCANCFSFLFFLSFSTFFFFFYLPDIVIHIMFQLLGLAEEVREALCFAKRSAPKEASGPGGCTLEGCTQQRDPFLGHSPAATDKSHSHHARKVITFSPT